MTSNFDSMGVRRRNIHQGKVAEVFDTSLPQMHATSPQRIGGNAKALGLCALDRRDHQVGDYRERHEQSVHFKRHLANLLPNVADNRLAEGKSG